MNFGDIFNKAFVEGFANADLGFMEMALVFGLSVALGSYIFLVYRFVCRQAFYSKQFNVSLAVLPVIVAAIILAVQSSVVISLGMVGALSIVRFRTAIKDPMDLVFLFWSISVGIACGAGMLEIAVAGSMILTLIIFLLDRLPLAKAAMILVVNADAGKEQTGRITELVKKYSKYYKVKSRNITNGQLDMVMELWVSEEDALTQDLAALECVHSVSLLSHDGEVTF